jgi:hypothetical protein
VPTATQQPSAGPPTKTIYEEYPLLTRVRNVLNFVDTTEKSTGKAQYKILQTPQTNGPFSQLGPFMNKFNWSALKNDPRLTAAQKKTIDKILVSLQVPARDDFRNRPALIFNIKNKQFLNANGSVNIAKVNGEVLKRLPKKKPMKENNNNVFYNAQQQINNKPEVQKAKTFVPTYGVF